MTDTATPDAVAPPSEDDSAGRDKPTASSLVRWSVALALTFGVGLLSIFGLLDVCSTVIDGSGTTTSCRAPVLTDGAIILTVVALLLLLLPDASELDFFGIRLRGRVELADEKADQAKREVDHLSSLVVAQTMSNTINVHTSTNYSTSELNAAKERTSQDLAEEEGAIEDPHASVTDGRWQPATPEQALTLVRRWEDFASEVGLRTGAPRDLLRASTDRRYRREAFLREYQAEVDQVRALRNSIAHGGIVKDVNVDAALITLANLEELWRHFAPDELDD